ncbi:MAG: AbrB/MazE/SpoVT family DNA-binding domain-containing protein [Firmicutes bacterium]|nr:AbrB/MazE/SpoVT family DNA-binding domain-containing protein [Bacillota bacterium]
MNTQILTVSSKGQISLPVGIRKLLSIDTGDKLVAYTSGDVIMLKTLKLPSTEEFEAALDEAQKWAMSAGYNENDVDNIIKSVRKKKQV